MHELPDNNYDEARRWLANTEDDLATMRAVQRDPDSPRRMVCFLAHLVVEKALKAVLIDAGAPFMKSHDLESLYAMCRNAQRLPRLDTGTLESLSPWAIDGRYADDLVEAERGLAERVAQFAGQVMDQVRSELRERDGGQ